MPSLVIYQICIYLSIYIWLPLHHFAIFNSFILTRALSSIFCITSDAILKRRITATENDRNVAPFAYLPFHSTVVWFSSDGTCISHMKKMKWVGEQVGTESVLRCKGLRVVLYFLFLFSTIFRTLQELENLEYFTAIIRSNSMAFIIHEVWLQNKRGFCAGILFYFLQALDEERPACFNTNFHFNSFNFSIKIN